MSNLLLVNDALRLIGVLPEGQDATAEQGETALRVFTDIVNEWQDDGILVSWEPSTELSGDCSLTGTELTASKYALAVKLCPHYGRDPSASLAMMANNAVNKLIRQQISRSMEAADPVLPLPEGYWQGYDITRGN